MKAVVTGGAGFIGSHLVDRLLEDGHEVVVLDDLSGGTLDNLSFAPCMILRRDSLGRADMARLRENLEGGRRCDVLYHLAADATEGRSQFTPWRCTMDGLAASAQVFAAAAAVGVKRIVFTSSMAVYGDQPAPFTEDMEPRPVDCYGVNKWGAERMLQILAETHGFEYVVLRPHNVYGPRQNPMDRYRNVVTIFINRLLRGEPMQIYGDGMQVRAFTWIGDVIGQVAEAGWRPEVANQIFNVGTDYCVTVKELATIVERVARDTVIPWAWTDHERLHAEFLPARPCEVHKAYCNNRNWWKVTGQELPAPTPLREGIRAVVEWMKEIGPQEPPHMEMEIPSDRVPEPWKER